MNKVFLLGNLGQDAKTATLNGGSFVANFSVAVNEKWKDKSGAQQERTTWFNCGYFGKGAEAVAKYLVAGKQVLVEGRLQTRKYEKDGQTHYATEVVVSELKLLGGGDKAGKSAGPRQSDSGGYDAPPDNFDASDLPF